MSQTLLRLGLWTVLIVLAMYVLRETFADTPQAELANDEILQRVGGIGLLLIAGAAVMAVIEKLSGNVRLRRCAKCSQRVARGEIYCRRHLREVLDFQDEMSRRSRYR